MSPSRFPPMPQATLIDGRNDLTMSSTATLSVEPSIGRLTPGAEIAVEIVVPVYNEQLDLATSIERLHNYLTRNFPLSWLITVADNASTDNTWAIACGLAQQLDCVRALHIPQKGRGRALRSAWLQSSAAVVAYMDVDLSTDLDALLPLVAPLFTGHSDVAIGSRLAPGARVVRGPSGSSFRAATTSYCELHSEILSPMRNAGSRPCDRRSPASLSLLSKTTGGFSTRRCSS